jgi:hypothetical protein
MDISSFFLFFTENHSDGHSYFTVENQTHIPLQIGIQESVVLNLELLMLACSDCRDKMKKKACSLGHISLGGGEN